MTPTHNSRRRTASSHGGGFRRISAAVAVALSLAFSLALSLAAPGTAKGSVDPTTLNPPPPDFFNASCSDTGSHITCTLAFTDPDIVDEPSGIVCGTTELLVTQHRSVVGKRFYDAAGDLVQRHFRESFDGTFTNPRTGKVALWTQHDTVLHNLGIPGDVASGTTSFTGLGTRVWLDGGGTIINDAGTTLVDSATDEVVRLSAHHPFDDYFRLGDASALAAICAALA